MQITEIQLRAFLTEYLRAEVTGIEPVGLGEWSQTFYFTADRQRKVVRFSAYDEDFQKDRFAAGFASPDLPIPQIEVIGAAFDQYFAISPRVDGTMIDHLSAEAMRETVPALVDLLVALHAVDGSGTRGYGGFGADGNGSAASWREYLPLQHSNEPGARLGGWKTNLARDQAVNDLYQVGRERLLALLPLCPEERHLIHNDLMHFNLIIRDHQVAAVIDWGCAMWGDFLYDLALITAWQFYYPSMAGIDIAAAAQRAYTAKGIALPHFRERLQCYQIHLLLDSLGYNAWKQDPENLEITARRLNEVLAEI